VDGIRYRNVTGVQTCALPISKGSLRFRNLDAHEGPLPVPVLGLPAGVHLLLPLTQNPPTPVAEGVEGLSPFLVPVDEPLGRHPLQHRSEERRVGRECSDRMLPTQ